MHVWRYLGGPWSSVASIPFKRSPAEPADGLRGSLYARIAAIAVAMRPRSDGFAV